MLEDTRAFVWAQIKAIKPAFVSKKPHFNFISAHYFWIVGATIVASILIFAGGKGDLDYVNALMFASGANTQAGLNPVDVNLLNLFQQLTIYLFTMMSNPITLHASVVFLRLYWFEKRFQNWVRDARQRRGTISKSKSTARNDVDRAEEGVNGRNITVVPRNGTAPRLTNDGIVLDEGRQNVSKAVGHSDESDTTTVTDEPSNSIELGPLDKPPEATSEKTGTQNGAAAENHDHEQEFENHLAGHTGITFAETVKRSDGVGDDPTKFAAQHRANAEHIAIVERQRNQDNEVLRIPGPRDAERGLGPRRLEHDDPDDEENAMARATTAESRQDHAAGESGHIRGRQPTITIAEPERRRRDEITDDVKAVGSTVDALRFRKPRAFNKGQNKIHEDNESVSRPLAVRTRTLETIRSVLSRDKTDDMPYLSYTPTIARNSNFVGLTLEQREELGGIEYRSLRTLALVLICYFFGFQLIVLSCLLPYIRNNDFYGAIVEKAGVSRTWWGFWTANSAFMDLGLTLTPDSMSSFQRSEFVLMVMWFFIIIGNTGFPVMLRFVIWVMSRVVPVGSGIWEELRFLLDHPRRCFTLLFPSAANWWLFWILFTLNAIDVLFFLVLDLGSEPIAKVPLGNRVVIGLFQAATTRTAGFSAVNLATLHPAMPVLYMIMMYISVFPIAISIRRTNVYEEKSLGVYDKGDDDDAGDGDASAFSYVGTHLRRQLSFDLWFVFLGFFVLAISEGSKLQAGDFDLFDCLFEIISAYGTVGLSMGVPNVNASLCSQFSVVGKLVIIAMQIRGRHRGLPYGLDRAVLLPSESRFKKEAEEAEATLARTYTGLSGATTTGLQRHGTGMGRGTSMGRSRSRSRERERANSNIISQFLHPGPVVQHDAPLARQRSRSMDARGQVLEPQRSQTDTIAEDELEELAPLPSISSHNKPRRADTSPLF